MYPARELTHLANHKAALRRDIAVRRTQCATAAARLAQPIAWLDRAVAFWRRLSPLTQFAALPLGLLVRHTFLSRFKLLGRLLRWGPLAFNVARSMWAARSTAASAQ